MSSFGGADEFAVRSMPNMGGAPGKPSTVTIVEKVEDLPGVKDVAQVRGRGASDCCPRFDSGKSDIRTVAAKGNDIWDPMESEWDVTDVDPDCRFDAILEAMKDMAAQLSKGEVIDDGATSIISADNEATAQQGLFIPILDGPLAYGAVIARRRKRS